MFRDKEFRNYDGRPEIQALLPKIGQIYDKVVFKQTAKRSGKRLFIATRELPNTEFPRFILQITGDQVLVGNPYRVRVVQEPDLDILKDGQVPRFICEIVE